MMNTSTPRILQKEMKKLMDLAHKSLVILTLDHEEYHKIIGQIFQRVNGATTSFQVSLYSYKLIYLLIVCSQFEMANSILETANMIHDDIKARILVSGLVTETYQLTESRPGTFAPFQKG